MFSHEIFVIRVIMCDFTVHSAWPGFTAEDRSSRSTETSFGSEQRFLCTYLLSVGANAFMWRNMTESSPKQQQVINVFGWSNT